MSQERQGARIGCALQERHAARKECACACRKRGKEPENSALQHEIEMEQKYTCATKIG